VELAKPSARPVVAAACVDDGFAIVA
jgi:hypothetical protein